MRRTALACLLGGAALIAPVSAVAEHPTWVVGRDPALVREACDALASRTAQPATSRFPSAYAQQIADYQLAGQRVEDATAAYRKGRLDQAWSAIAEAVAAYDRSLAVVEDFEAVARAYLFQADLATARGDNARAEENYLAAARLAPDLKLDPAATSPVVIEGFGTAHTLLKNSPTGGLSVVSKPVGASVAVDGTLRGNAPLSVVLASGPHLAVVRLRGYDVWATQVPVEANDVRKLEVFLAEASSIDIAAEEGTLESARRLPDLDPAADWLVVSRSAGGVRYVYAPAGVAPVSGGPVAVSALTAELTAVDESNERGPMAVLPTWAWYAAGIGGGAALLAAGVGAAVYFLWPEAPAPRYLSVYSK